MPSRRFGRATRFLLRLPTHLYDWHAGWLLGNRFLRLTHLGRKSGRRYQTVLEVVGTDRATGELVVMAGFGRSSDWFRNIQAAPAVEIAINGRRFPPRHRILDENQAAAALADYERRNRLIAPIVRRALSRLAGWPYNGSPAARHRLVRQLPTVGFRPLSDSETPIYAAAITPSAGSIPQSREAPGASPPHLTDTQREGSAAPGCVIPAGGSAAD